MSNINITDLDFDGIKNALKEFLKSKDSPIKDYNYEGSAFNIILDVLAVNTHYNALYTNFVANEMFLDSALLRSSVVSIAKELGYIPRSARASRAKLKVSVGPFISGNSVINVPARTRFTTNVDGVPYNYFNVFEEFLSWSVIDNAYVGEFEVICGDIYTQSFTVSNQKKFLLEADDIDLSTLLVQVRNSALDSETRTFTFFDKIINLSPDSPVYFISETDLKRYEIRFGDDVLGKSLVNGNIVLATYVATNLEAPLGATQFLPAPDFYSSFTVSVEAVTASSGPSEIEDTESIKNNIQRYNQSQNRSVISSDYEYNILNAIPDIRSCIVWGGEDNDPPQYGKVFASCILDNLSSIPQSRKIAIANEIKSRSTINIRPEIIDPDYIDIIVYGYVRFNQQELGYSSGELKDLIISVMRNYSETELEKFNSVFAFSKLASNINEIDNAVKSVVFNFKLSNKIRIDPSVKKYEQKNYRNGIKQGSFISTRYYLDGNTNNPHQIEDLNGSLIEYVFPDNIEENKTFKRTVGNINYDTGKVNFSGIYGEPLDGTSNLVFQFDVQSGEISSDFNQVLKIDSNASAVRIEVRA